MRPINHSITTVAGFPRTALHQRAATSEDPDLVQTGQPAPPKEVNLKGMLALKQEPQYVSARKQGTTAVITLDKPQKNNALDGAMLAQLSTAVREADRDASVRHIVIESAFPKSFSQGADLAWVKDQADEFESTSWVVGISNALGGVVPPFKLLGQYWTFRNVAKPYFNQGIETMATLAGTSKPTIARVQGHALGGGLELALACDYIVAADDANLGFPEIHHGIFPAWGGTERLPERLGKPLARWMILEGGYFGKGGSGPAMLSGTDAATVGLVDRSVPADQLDAAVADLIQSGAADAKAVRDPDNLDHSGTRFEALKQRYATATTEDLMNQELAGLYNTLPDPTVQEKMKRVLTDAVELAEARIEAGRPYHTEGELMEALQNSMKVQRYRK